LSRKLGRKLVPQSLLVMETGLSSIGNPASQALLKSCSDLEEATADSTKAIDAQLQSVVRSSTSVWARSRRLETSWNRNEKQGCGVGMKSNLSALLAAHRVVVKVGSSSVSGEQSGQIAPLVDLLVDMQRRGTQVVLVSSGAISTGVPFLEID